MSDPLQRAGVSLHIVGDDLVPDELTMLLGCQPQFSQRKGQTFIRRNGPVRTARTGVWDTTTGVREPPCIDLQITDLLAKLPQDTTLWNDLTRRFDCYLAVEVWFPDDSWTGGITLRPETLRMLGERGLTIDFDMYAPAASD